MAAFGLFTGSEALHHRAVSQSLAFRELRAYLTAAADGFAHVVLGDDDAGDNDDFTSDDRWIYLPCTDDVRSCGLRTRRSRVGSALDPHEFGP